MNQSFVIVSLLALSLATTTIIGAETPVQGNTIRILVNPELGSHQAPYATEPLSGQEDKSASLAHSAKPAKSDSSSASHPIGGWKIATEETVEHASNVEPKVGWAGDQEGDQATIDRIDSFQLASDVQPMAVPQSSQEANVAPIVHQLVASSSRRGPQSMSQSQPELQSQSQFESESHTPSRLPISLPNSRRAQTPRPVVEDRQFGMPVTRPSSGNDETDAQAGDTASQGSGQPSLLDLLAVLSTSTTTMAPPTDRQPIQEDGQSGDYSSSSSRKQEFGQEAPSRTKINGVGGGSPITDTNRQPYVEPQPRPQAQPQPQRQPQPVTDSSQARKPTVRPPLPTLISSDSGSLRRPVSSKPATMCPPTGISTVEHPTSCDKYYLCSNGQATEQQCPNGLMYGTRDTVVDFCVHRWNTTCGEKTIPNPISSPGCRWQYGIFPVQGSPKCSIDYYECKAGKHEVKRCSQEGQMYDDRTKSCQWAEILGCQSDSVAQFQCPPDDQGNTYWPFPRYYLNQQDIIMCVNDKPQIVHCADHQRVDPEHLHCVPNENEQREARAKKSKKAQPKKKATD